MSPTPAVLLGFGCLVFVAGLARYFWRSHVNAAINRFTPSLLPLPQRREPVRLKQPLVVSVRSPSKTADQLPAFAAKPGQISLGGLSEDVLAEVLSGLRLPEIAAVATALKLRAAQDLGGRVWAQAVRGCCWPAGEDLAGLTFVLEQVMQRWGPEMSWGEYCRHRVQRRRCLAVDLGRGYSKFAIVDAVHGIVTEPAPVVLQHCSSPTNPPDARREQVYLAITAELANAQVPGTVRPLTSVDRVVIGLPFDAAVGPAGALRDRQLAEEHNSRQLLQEQALRCTVVVPQPVLALAAHRRKTGFVINIGQAQTIGVAVLNGEVVAGATCRLGIGSAQLTQVMLRLLMMKHTWVSQVHMTFARDLKEKYCCVSRSPLRGQADAHGALPPAFNAEPVTVAASPQWQTRELQLADERQRVPEVLFDPPGAEGDAGLGTGLHHLCVRGMRVAAEITGADVGDFCSSIAVVGGTASIRGLSERLEKEVQGLLSHADDCDVSARVLDCPCERKHAIWYGAAMHGLWT
mmetsp:Transcript_6781/g.16649  ORF Transcript_6781/g.16649 Transcript_6781/m.16649 type:complete len:519 (+) Transcript_6781:36-1592(+)